MSDPIFELNFEVDDLLYKEVIDMWPKLLATAKRKKRFGWLREIALWTIVFLVALFLFRAGMPVDWAIAFFLGVFAVLLTILAMCKFFLAPGHKQILLRRHGRAAHGNRVRILISKDGIVEKQSGAMRSWDWAGIDQIYALKRGTAVIRGVDQIIISNDGLPSDKTPDAFRTDLEDLRVNA
ncbi:hypothetical protein [Yoonia sp. BS5-3]|uniref:YcxB family protein n=1 Tax=Yoonia phaeophyticola TaxID=3137369 RepID=A0ABZ2V5V4_9RHOB